MNPFFPLNSQVQPCSHFTSLTIVNQDNVLNIKIPFFHINFRDQSGFRRGNPRLLKKKVRPCMT